MTKSKFSKELFSFYFLSSILYFLFFTAGCATVPGQGVETGQESIAIDSAEEALVGRSMQENIIKRKVPPVPDAARQLFVNKIGQRIAQVCDRRDIVYHFMILDSPDLNAFAIPGGYIFIYDGLVKRLEEPELAALWAHEIAHVVKRHAINKMQSMLGEELLMGLAMLGLGQKNQAFDEEIAQATPRIFEFLNRGYDFVEEVEVDRLACVYLERAGYDPLALARVLNMLSRETGPGGRVFEISNSRSRLNERVRIIEGDVSKRKTAQ